MRTDVIRDGGVGNSRLWLAGFGRWPISYLLRGESVLALGRKLAAAVRASIVAPPPRAAGAKIRVSPMSTTWLRLHEGEYDKHRTER